jgi:Xaa-Pro aminopeptidase
MTNIPVSLPFGEAEHRARAARVRAELARRGIDALVVTSPANVFYLTGYEAAWFPPKLPVGVVVSQSSDDLVFLDWARHEDYVQRWALYDDVVLFEYDDWPTVLAAACAERGWAGGVVGLEPGATNPTAAVFARLSDDLRAAGTEVVDASLLVDDVRLLKTPAEIERIRRAAAIADDAFAALREQLRPGMTELEVAARAELLLAERGSEPAANTPFVSSGPEAWRDVHAFPSRRVLEAGDVLDVDICGVVERYHVNLSRAFSIGPAPAAARELVAKAEDAAAVLARAARLGEPLQVALAEAERSVRAEVPPERVWWIGGYSLGAAFPPGWVGHRYLANEIPEPLTWQPGYLSNFETVLVDEGMGISAPIIDSILMTDDGLEVLSTLPRELLET